MAVKPIPEGYHTVTPYLAVQGAGKLFDFLKNGLEAKEVYRMAMPDGKIMHAEVRIGDSKVMLGEAQDPSKVTPANLYVYVNDCDASYKRALHAGATAVREPADQFYGDRSGTVKDAFGNYWSFATHKEDVPPDEMKRRAEAAMCQQKK